MNNGTPSVRSATPNQPRIVASTLVTFRRKNIAEEVKDLSEAWMKHADQLLGDPEIVAEALAQQRPLSRKRSRPGAPADVPATASVTPPEAIGPYRR
jgi:hypothetical protein